MIPCLHINMDDQTYDNILKYLTRADHGYPEEIYKLKGDDRSNAKSKFRQIAKPYRAENGTLFHGSKEVLPKHRLKTVLEACHDNHTTGGHFATERTYRKISAKFYWKGEYKLCKELIERGQYYILYFGNESYLSM